MWKVFLVIFIIAFSLLNKGCNKVAEGPTPGVRVDDPKAPHATIIYNKVAILDKSLQTWDTKKNEIKGKIAVESQGGRRTDAGTLEVFATLRNRTDYPLHIEGRVQFFDRDKIPIEGPTAWQRVILPANSVAAYKEKSTRVDVAYYYTEIREGR